jgi:predicted dinucleotide-binding enzyme
MKVGILGTGPVAQALGRGFLLLGHEVKLGGRQAGGDKAAGWVKASGSAASEGTLAEAAAFGDLLVLAVLGTAIPEAVAAAGPENFSGKVVIDTTNPLDFSSGVGQLAIAGRDSCGETVQRLLPGAKVVKTFNTVNHAFMVRPRWEGGIPDMFLAGDDAEAKRQVRDILVAFGWNPVDLGGILSARWLEAMCMAWVNVAMPSNRWNAAFKVIDLEKGA